MFSIYIKASLWCEITCRWRKQLHKLWKERKQFFGCKFSLYPGSTFIYVPDKICLEHVNGWNSTIAAYKHYNVIVIPTSFQILRLPRCRWFGSRWRSPISSIHLRLQCRSRRPGYLGKNIYIIILKQNKKYIYMVVNSIAWKFLMALNEVRCIMQVLLKVLALKLTQFQLFPGFWFHPLLLEFAVNEPLFRSMNHWPCI